MFSSYYLSTIFIHHEPLDDFRTLEWLAWIARKVETRRKWLECSSFAAKRQHPKMFPVRLSPQFGASLGSIIILKHTAFRTVRPPHHSPWLAPSIVSVQSSMASETAERTSPVALFFFLCVRVCPRRSFNYVCETKINTAELQIRELS